MVPRHSAVRDHAGLLEPDLIQVAGILDQAEADLLQACGVRYLGFPLRLAVHQEDLSEPEAARIIRSLRWPARAVVITYEHEAGAIVELCAGLGARIVQLHGEVPAHELRRLRSMDEGLAIIKSLVVGLHAVPTLEGMVRELSPLVDGFITDTFAPDTGAWGATGRTHDWTVSRRLAELSLHPVILAGGLTQANVRRAILEVRPAGVDAHTGLELPSGRKSREKVLAFVAEARAGFRMLRGESAP